MSVLSSVRVGLQERPLAKGSDRPWWEGLSTSNVFSDAPESRPTQSARSHRRPLDHGMPSHSIWRLAEAGESNCRWEVFSLRVRRLLHRSTCVGRADRSIQGMAGNLDFGSLRLTLAVKHYRRSRLASRSDLPSALIDSTVQHGPGLGRHVDCRRFSRMNGVWKPSALRLKRRYSAAVS
jgi:hypothetical protein